jgi:hypothetical protein
LICGLSGEEPTPEADEDISFFIAFAEGRVCLFAWQMAVLLMTDKVNSKALVLCFSLRAPGSKSRRPHQRQEALKTLRF